MNKSSLLLKSNTLKAAVGDVLHASLQTHTGVEFLLAATSDGYIFSDTLPEDTSINKEGLAAMAASFAGISESLAIQSSKPPASGSIIETNEGLLVCKQLKCNRNEIVLLGAFSISTNHGIALWALNNTVKDILSLLKQYN
jgi:predicted regulator of Ras-like GTPase activity (Roadblock/LC7/MglB family)